MRGWCTHLSRVVQGWVSLASAAAKDKKSTQYLKKLNKAETYYTDLLERNKELRKAPKL